MNELLQQLESYRGLVVCTTNLLRDLDPAALRRFIFKIEFAHSGPRECEVLFEALLARFLPEPDRAEAAVVARELARIPNLGPGDFAAVARRFSALGGRRDVHELMAALAGESKVKQGPRAAAGFA